MTSNPSSLFPNPWAGSPPRTVLTDDLLLAYKRCDRRFFLNLRGDPRQQDPERDFIHKLRQENQQQIQAFLAAETWVQPDYVPGDWERAAQATEALMAEGVPGLYRGLLLGAWEPTPGSPISLLGRPTFLRRQPGRSRWGDWCYQPVNIKLGKRPKPEYKLVAALHAYLLAEVQGGPVPAPELVLREHQSYWVDLDNWQPRLLEAIADCHQLLAANDPPEVFISRQRCSLCRWLTACQTEAREQQHLSLVPGVTPSRYEDLRRLGVNTLADLAHLEPWQAAAVLTPEAASQLQAQAQALLAGQAFLRPDRRSCYHQPLPQGRIELYFDVEAEPDRNVDFLLGVLVVNHRTGTERFHAFLAETPAEEALIWQQFLALLLRYPEAPIFHFSAYEVETVQRLATLYKTAQVPLPQVLSRFVDLHAWVTQSAVLPVENYSLKTLAKWLGFAWRDAEASGDQTVCWYDRWLRQGDRQLLEAIVRYNEDDCRATYRLKQWFEAFLASAAPPPPLAVNA